MKGFMIKFNRIVRQHVGLMVLALSAVCMIFAISVGITKAYFTTYATAKGSLTVNLGHESKIKEGFKDWQKDISIENTGDVDVFVRCKVICASQFTVTASGSNWTLANDGYYYYSKMVPVGGTTDSLLAYIKVSEEVESSFNIVVVQECTPVVYDSEGNPCLAENAKWDEKAKFSYGEADE